MAVSQPHLRASGRPRLVHLTTAFHSVESRIAGALFIAAAVALPLVPGYHGLLACPLRTLVGIPCPLCGMSTSVHASVRGNIDEAVAANPAGLGAVLFAVVLVIRPPKHLRVRGPFLVALLAAMWVFQLVRFEIV